MNSKVNLDPHLEPERRTSFWQASLDDMDSLPILERAYRSVIVLLIESGLRGLAGVKTARIAELAGTTESTLFRHVDSRDHLVAQSVDWCWSVLNERLARKSFEHAIATSSPQEVVLNDCRAILEMYDDDLGRLCGTGVFLSFRRSEALVGEFDHSHQERFTKRLNSLCDQLMVDCDRSDDSAAVIGTFVTNSLATVWFTWLFDSSSRQPSGMLGTEFVLHGLERYLDDVAMCRFQAQDSL